MLEFLLLLGFATVTSGKKTFSCKALHSSAAAAAHSGQLLQVKNSTNQHPAEKASDLLSSRSWVDHITILFKD